MKFFKYCLLIIVSHSLFSQVSQDSIALKKLKAEIKQELLNELQNQSKTTENASSHGIDKFSLHGYSAVNYYHYDYDTDPELKDKIDAERLNIYPEYEFNDWISFRSEIEFEHGGTGAAIGYDTQEEFGEFEQEIEKGGSIKLEQIYADFKINSHFNIKAGRIKVLFNLAQSLDDPDEYFTTHRQEMENMLTPLGWYEIGIGFYGTFAKKFNYYFTLTNGLDSSGFNSSGWIKNGHQERFEMATAEAFATMLRLDYKFGRHKHTYVGMSAYIGDSAANRPKNDLKETAYVTMLEGHFTYNEFPLRVYTVGIYGNLENSNIVSQRNANLSNNLGVKRTPVGKNAVGFTTEVGYEVLHHFSNFKQHMLYPFFRYDYYDSMHEVEGSVIDNPRWQRSTITTGLNWFIAQEITIKAQYSNRRLGSENYDLNTLLYTGKKQQENTFSLGIGFEF
ncbi:autotransporter outer membrane beta-barrel domain-containing protein [Flavobacterium sp. CYK-4]|uniref:autotransporter outer membrane beta-barrel domain-containing protein n=1 Tax=Flavobacterium lotistagni TaxID=2709660 RepID=UPI00140B73D4|nr:autotransporter outer membrane beta-barrel domain-containing protein [Flavobacterium lotistagni]NHM06341.1 autotransporter outer membrane beta-barrel domain-containing protein [Flavobacterium lotistagni]